MTEPRGESDLHRAWGRKLYRWWHHYNEEYLDGVLRVPLIELGGGGEVLGSWNISKRLLRIAEEHVATDPWLCVMETLRHEMAHQYAHEVLKAVGETPHGPAFRRSCEKLRCTPAARAKVEDEHGKSAEDHLLQRLQKVLSLTDSPNEHEAETAVKKARRLLLKYNIDAVQIDRERAFGHRCLGSIKGRRASCELWLALILQEFFFVETLWVPTYRASEDKPGTVLEIYGTPASLDMAEYVYTFLRGLLERLWSDYRLAHALPGNRERQRYYGGVLEGFHHKLSEQEQQIVTDRALVWKGDSQLKTYYRYINPRVQTRYGSGVAESAAYRDGLAEGHKVHIHRPVESPAGFGGYLKGA